MAVARHTAKLNPDILHLVSQRFYHDFVKHAFNISSRRLENLQPLTATCAAWRQASVPLLYRTVICELRQQRRSWAKDQTYWKTNIHLLASSQSAHHARELLIVSAHTIIDTRTLLQTLMESGFGSHDWSGVTSLYFYQGGRLYSHVSPAGDDPSSIASLNEYLAHCLPNLKHISYESLVDDSLYQENPFNRLINSRLSNLQEVVIGSQHYPLLTAPSFSPCLTTLSIRCRSQGAVQLPHIVAQSLVELCLTEIPAVHIWDLIDTITAGQQGLAQFPQLSKLDLDFAQETMAGGDMGMPMGMTQPWVATEQLPAGRHTFPRLRRLNIRRYPFSIHEYLAAFPCDQLTSFMLEGSGRGMLSVDASEFRTLREAHIACLGIFRFGEDRAERFLENVLSVSSPMRKLKVTLISHSNIKLPRRFGCEFLQSLDLRVPVNLSAVEMAICHLQHLWRLNIPYTKTDVQIPIDSVDVLRARMRQQQNAPVFVSKSIQQLELGFWDYKQTTTPLCYHVLTFIARIPSLLCVITESNFAASLKGIITYLPSNINVLPSTRELSVKSNSI